MTTMFTMFKEIEEEINLVECNFKSNISWDLEQHLIQRIFCIIQFIFLDRLDVFIPSRYFGSHHIRKLPPAQDPTYVKGTYIYMLKVHWLISTSAEYTIILPHWKPTLYKKCYHFHNFGTTGFHHFCQVPA